MPSRPGIVLPVVHRPRPNSAATSRETPRAPRYGMPASRSSVSGKPSGRLAAGEAAPGPPEAAGSAFAPRDVGWTVALAVAALGPSWRAPGPFAGPPLIGASMPQTAASLWPASRIDTVVPSLVSTRCTKSRRLPEPQPAWQFQRPWARLTEQLGC